MSFQILFIPLLLCILIKQVIGLLESPGYADMLPTTRYGDEFGFDETSDLTAKFDLLKMKMRTTCIDRGFKVGAIR